MTKSNVANELGHTYYPKYMWDKLGNALKDQFGNHKIVNSEDEEIKFLTEFYPTVLESEKKSDTWGK